MKLRVEGGLLFVSAEVVIGGMAHRFDQVLIDTGSAGTLFAADRLLDLGVVAEPQDRLLRIRGVGGSEFVFAKQIERVSVGELTVTNFEIEIGAMDYGFPVDGILGLDFLLATRAVIDLAGMEIGLQG